MWTNARMWRRRLVRIGVIAAGYAFFSLSLYALTWMAVPILWPILWPVTYIVDSLAPGVLNWAMFYSSIALSSLLWAVALYALWDGRAGHVDREPGDATGTRRKRVGARAAPFIGGCLVCALLYFRFGWLIMQDWSAHQFATAFCYRPLSDFCKGDCPAYLEVDPDCDGRVEPMPTNRLTGSEGWTAACGDNYAIRYDNEFEGSPYTTRYAYFGANGQLAAVYDTSDANDFCEGKSYLIWYGKPVLCAVADEPADVDCSRWRRSRSPEGD